jgi:WD40 repeat protein
MNISQISLSPAFYVAGGTLRHDAPSYVDRQADRELCEALLGGQFCYVLTARQMGKSSLMVRTAARLREAGVEAAVLDLTAVGQNLSPEQWYGGLLAQLGQRLNLEDELIEFWQTQQMLGPLQRWIKAIREVALPRSTNRIVVFIDEIDAVRSLPFSADEFFAGIRECWNERGIDTRLESLTFCLLGVATPGDLIRDKRVTPFNIGRCVELYDFTTAEATLLARGLPDKSGRAAELLERVLYWTGGHPYLTQRLCQMVTDRHDSARAQIDRLCAGLFFTRQALERDDNLLFVRERLLRSDIDQASLLDLYQQIRNGKAIPDDESDPLVSALRLSGVTRSEDGRLKVRNRIYARVFDRRWITANMPGAELQRQHAAYQRGLLRAALVSASVMALVISLALLAFLQSRRAARQAEANRQQAEANHLLLYHTRMRLAQEMVERANIDRAEELLRATIPQPGQSDVRGFEWYHIWQLTHGEIWRIEENHPVFALSFVQNGNQLAVGEARRSMSSGSNEYLLKLYDAHAKQELRSFRVPAGKNFDLIVFLPDQRHAVVNGADQTASVLDLQTGEQVSVFSGHRAELSAIAPSPDGKTLATADMDGIIKLWDAATGRERFTLPRQRSMSRWAVFSPNGRWLATVADLSNQVRLWDVKTGGELPPITNDGGILTAAAFFPGGRRLLTADRNGSLQIWDLPTRRKLATLTGHQGYTQAIAFSPNGETFATGNYDRTVKIWSASTWQELETIKGHGSAVHAVAWSPDGKHLITGGADQSVKLWDIGTRQELMPPAEQVTSYLTMAFSMTEQLLAVGVTAEDRVKIWNLSSGQELARLDEQSKLLCATFSPDKTILATGGMGKEIKLWNVKTGALVKVLSGHTDYVYAIAFSPDGKLLVSGGSEQSLKLWDVATGGELASLRGDVDNYYQAVFSPDGRQMASACRDGSVNLWDVATRRVLFNLKGHMQRVRAIAFSNDGSLLATGGQDNSIRVWDTTTGRELKNLGQSDFTQRLAFSPDGKRLVTGSVNGAVKLWDLTTWQELMTLRGHSDEITSLTFSADGTSLASSSLDGTVRLWRAASGKDVPAN